MLSVFEFAFVVVVVVIFVSLVPLALKASVIKSTDVMNKSRVRKSLSSWSTLESKLGWR